MNSLRPALKPFRLARRAPAAKRLASTSTEAAQKKAQDALGAAQKGAEQLWAATTKLLGPVGERLGGLLGAYRAPLAYNLAVAREVAKQVYVREGLAPPSSLAEVADVYRTLWRRASSAAYWREIARNGDWARVGVYAVEAYGIFKIGEIIGRRSLVGYKVVDH